MDGVNVTYDVNLHLIVLEVLVGGLILCGIRAYLMIKELWIWHGKEDDEGIKVWYVRKSLGDAIDKIATVMDRIERREDQRERVLEGLVDAVQRMADHQDRMEAQR